MSRRHVLFAALAALCAAGPAMAHHGKDFMLVETDDMPQPGRVYSLLSSDTNVEPDGARSTEVTPGLLFAVGDRVAVEPHLHVARSTDEGWHYDATAASIKYRIGYLPRSDWRAAISVEAERPRHVGSSPAEPVPTAALRGGRPLHGDQADAEVVRSEGTLRLDLTRAYPTALVAVNLLAGRELARGGDRTYGFAVGALAPLPSGDRAGLEVLSRFPFSDGVEIVPGYYHSAGATSMKLGVGLFTSRATTTGTLHATFLYVH